MPELVSVLVDLVTAATNRVFTYSVPEHLSGQVGCGAKVRIPFGHRVLTGYVVPETPEVVESIRPISAVLEQNMFTKEGWQLACWVSERYLCHLVKALYLLLPPGTGSKRSFKRQKEYVDLAISDQEAQTLIADLGRRAPAQVRLLKTLLQDRPRVRQELLREAPAAISSLKALISRGAVTTWTEESFSSELDYVTSSATADTPPVLTPDQSRALSPIIDALRSNRSESFLLHGVTGSGKTEIYLRVLTAALEQGRGGIVLVPEIALTPQMQDRFVGRFGRRVAILHSGLRDRERYVQWRRIQRGEAQVVVGARSAVYAPLDNIGAIILDEEHETAYKQEESPRYHAREVALWRAHSQGAVTILGSATPAVETYFQAQNGRHCLLTLPKRIAHRPLPQVGVVDMRRELLAGNRSIFSRALQNELSKILAAKQQAILFLNRRGYSTFVLCRRCGHVAECPHCELSLTLHKPKQRLLCHHCGYAEPAYHICPKCGSSYVRDFGCGTQRVASEAKRMWPKARILRLDADTSSRTGATEEIIGAFAKGRADILVGTQMVAKGLDFARVTLVGIISADLTLNLPDPYAWERTFQLLAQVSGRTGRGEVPGRAILQTYTPNHASITAAQRHDYAGFYQVELKRRKRLFYPPFSQVILVRALAPKEQVAKQLLQELLQELRLSKDITVEGPAPCPFLKVGDKYRWQIIFKGPNLDRLRNQLSMVLPTLASVRHKMGARLTVDVDPLSYL